MSTGRSESLGSPDERGSSPESGRPENGGGESGESGEDHGRKREVGGKRGWVVQKAEDSAPNMDCVSPQGHFLLSSITTCSRSFICSHNQERIKKTI